MIIQAGIPCKLTNDSKRLLLEHFDAIHNSPFQIYHLALLFSPSSSWLCKCYSAELPLKVKVVKGLPAEWGACSRTVSPNYIMLALSYWNNTVAAGSGIGNIRIFDAITGSQVAVLSGHTSAVRSVVFSSDGRLIVSGSDDTTVKLWDMQTGGVVKTLYGHTGQVLSVSTSEDQTRIASGSDDNIIHLWDITTGECLCTIEQQEGVHYVSFSPLDPQHIISVSGGKVWQWDTSGHQLSLIGGGTHIAFSPEHTQFALCNGNVITVQNFSSRTIVAEFYMADDNTSCCCFSPDGRLVAAAAGNIAYVWNITSSNPHLVETFVGHSEKILSLVFSSPFSLISSSCDFLVKVWQIGVLSTGPATTDQQPTSAPIKSVSLQAMAGIAVSHDNNGVVKIWDISTGLCKSTFQIPVAGDINSQNGDGRLINGRLIFVWHGDEGIHIWDTEKGELLQTLDTTWCLEIRISGDGSKIFSLHEKSIQAWSMWTWELVGEVILGLELDSHLDPLCLDKSRVRIYSKQLSTWEGWDFGTSGSSPIPFDPSIGRPCLDLIGGVPWWVTGSAQIKDTITGKVVFRLSGKYSKANDLQWDGQYLVAGYDSGEVLILDFHDIYPQ
jgi:WD40 repeat protein